MIGALAIATIAAAVMSDEEKACREEHRHEIFWFSLIEWPDGSELRRYADHTPDCERAFTLGDPPLRGTPRYSYMAFSTIEDDLPFLDFRNQTYTADAYFLLEKFFPVQRPRTMQQVTVDRDFKTQPLQRPVWVSPLLRRTSLEQATGQLPVGLREESALRGHLFDLLPLFMTPAEIEGTRK